MKNNEWRTFFIGIFFCLMIGLAFGACTGGYDDWDEEGYRERYNEGKKEGYKKGKRLSDR